MQWFFCASRSDSRAFDSQGVARSAAGPMARGLRVGVAAIAMILALACQPSLAAGDSVVESAPAASASSADPTPPPSTPDTAANREIPAGTAESTTFQSLDEEAQGLKAQVMDLNRELFMLEEELLFPANTQVSVYVSYDVGTFFALDSIQVRVDDKEVANYLYTEREVRALERGGVHRVWLGNMKVGKHVVTAFFNGKGPHDRDYRTGATIEVEKGVGAKYLELKVSDRQRKLQPEFIVKQWD